MKRNEVISVIETVIQLSDILNLAISANEYIDDQEELLDIQIEHIYSAQNKLIQMVSEYIGIREDDFPGDEWCYFCDCLFNGELRADEILKIYENIKKYGIDRWWIEFHLCLLKKYDGEKFKNEFYRILNYMNVSEKEKIECTKMLLKFVNGEVDKEIVMEKYYCK